jgi:hypothetical protein
MAILGKIEDFAITPESMVKNDEIRFRDMLPGRKPSKAFFAALESVAQLVLAEYEDRS